MRWSCVCRRRCRAAFVAVRRTSRSPSGPTIIAARVDIDYWWRPPVRPSPLFRPIWRAGPLHLLGFEILCPTGQSPIPLFDIDAQRPTKNSAVMCTSAANYCKKRSQKYIFFEILLPAVFSRAFYCFPLYLYIIQQRTLPLYSITVSSCPLQIVSIWPLVWEQKNRMKRKKREIIESITVWKQICKRKWQTDDDDVVCNVVEFLSEVGSVRNCSMKNVSVQSDELRGLFWGNK